MTVRERGITLHRPRENIYHSPVLRVQLRSKGGKIIVSFLFFKELKNQRSLTNREEEEEEEN